MSLRAQPSAGRILKKWVLAVGSAAAAVGVGLTPIEGYGKGPTADRGVVSQSELPPEAVAVERLIRSNGPFAYAKDGAVFGNRERLIRRRGCRQSRGCRR